MDTNSQEPSQVPGLLHQFKDPRAQVIHTQVRALDTLVATLDLLAIIHKDISENKMLSKPQIFPDIVKMDQNVREDLCTFIKSTRHLLTFILYL